MGRPFPVEVGGDTVQMEILREEAGGQVNIAVEMGTARFGVEAVGGDPGVFGPSLRLDLPEGGALEVHPMSVGNPHCVSFRAELREDELFHLGPVLSSHRAFPFGINVQLAHIMGDHEVQILIWERGVGRTASSGTSACAVASAGVNAGFLQPGRIRVNMEGGCFVVTVSEDLAVRLEGPVQPLFSGELTEEFLEGLASGCSEGRRG